MTVPNLHRPLVIDIAGIALTADDRRRIASPHVGGLIHFARNFESRAQMAALNAEIRALRPDLLISVDHEGGRVQRFRADGFTHLPAMRTLGAAHAADPQRAAQAARAAGYVLAAELRAVGVDFSFAPVLDLDHGESAVIGDRSFDRDPAVVAALAGALTQGMADAGMRACGKHFPGHGWVRADSHVAIPVDERALAVILGDDALPFAALRDVLGAVMPAHVIYPQVDARPAGFSRRWLHDILRRQVGFAGAIFSDDLSMEAGRYLEGRLLGYGEAAAAALEAGCDLALLCNQSLPAHGGGAVLDALIAYFDDLAHWRPSAASEARRRALLPTTPAQHWQVMVQDGGYVMAREVLQTLLS